MAARSFYAIDSEALTVIFSTSQTVGDPVINNSDSPNGTQYVFGSGWSTRQITVDDSGGSLDTLEDDNSANHIITDGGGLVTNGNAVEAESFIQLQQLDATGTPTGPIITISVFSQNGTTGDVWGFASDAPLIPGVEYEKVGGSNTGSADYADYATSWIVSVDGTTGADSMGGGYSDAEGDQIDGADGNDDYIYGYGGADSINGGAGNDYIDGGDGADSFFLSNGFGTDTIVGGEGGTDDDLVDFSGLTSGVNAVLSSTQAGAATVGANTLDFSEIERFMLSGQNDTFDASAATAGVNVNAGAGRDSVVGGAGADTIRGGAGADTISGAAGNDRIFAGGGHDSVDGGLGNDRISGGGGRDTISGGAGNDTLIGGGGADRIDGGTGTDSILAGNGNDTILVSAGSDTIDGGTGTDTYNLNTGSLADGTATITVNSAGTGTSSKSDGSSDSFSSIERFVADEISGQTDTITITGTVDRATISGLNDTAVGIFTSDELGIPIPFGGPGQPTINQLLSGTYDPGTGPLNPKGTYAITSGEEDGAQIGTIAVQNFEEINFDVVCFARGTRIDTDRGEIAIEDLKAGDSVVTLDHGLQPIRWIGSTTVAAQGDHAPIEFKKGAFGNKRDLRVSPQHRMVLQGWRQELLFGELETLAPAKFLVNDCTIRRVEGGMVEYFHMLFDDHEIVFSEGIPSESFHPGEIGMNSCSDKTKEAIYSLFPHLRTDLKTYGSTARTSLKGFEVGLVSSSHSDSQSPMKEVRMVA